MTLAVLILVSLILLIQVVRWWGDIAREQRLKNIGAIATRIEQDYGNIAPQLDWANRRLLQVLLEIKGGTQSSAPEASHG